MEVGKFLSMVKDVLKPNVTEGQATGGNSWVTN